ncbi:MAG TPA: DUF4129 domain-containing protein [Solirubrobacteraceae bacterium]|nr:DUF4129 domain-containing protein [Solirubrobacteraceae bacterium]
MRAVVAVLACALACVCWPAVAHGAAATAAEVRALAAAAPRDRAALERLRAVDVVDGRPARLDRALRGTDVEVRARLRALAQRPAGGGAVEPGAARAQAREVLDQRRFQRTKVPAPLRDVRERIGEALRSLGRPFEGAFRWLADVIPGGRPVLWALLAAVVLSAAAFLAGRAGPRRGGAAADGAVERDARELMSAAALLVEAERAERRGDLEGALRLRFRAGLVELDDRKLIELRPALTNRELLGVVSSETLVELVDGFEAVAYGGRPADDDDLRDARDGWPRVPEEADTR